MKNNLHPNYHTATVSCVCGNSFEVGSTMEKISVDICSQCHPFYTGKQKLIDTAGRVDKFKERMERTQKLQDSRGKGKKAEKVEKVEEKKTLEDLK